MDKHHFEEEMAKGGSELNLVAVLGEVDIQTHAEQTITVDAETEHMDLTFRRDDNAVYVRLETDDSWRQLSNKLSQLLRNDHPRARLTVRVPADCQVRAKVVAGKLSVSGVDARVDTHVVTGSTRLENLGASVRAKAVSGNVHYHGRLSSDHHRFETVTGRIHLALEEIPDAKLDVSATTGSIRCDLPLDQPIERRHLTGTQLHSVLGSGKGYIKARVVTGSLQLEAA